MTFLLFKRSERSSNFFYSDRLKPIILKNSDLVPRWSEKAIKTLVTVLRQIFVCHVRSDLNQLQGVWGKDCTALILRRWYVLRAWIAFAALKPRKRLLSVGRLSSFLYSEVPNRRECSLRFFKFPFHPAPIFHVINEKFHSACLLIYLENKWAVLLISKPARLFQSACLLY